MKKNILIISILLVFVLQTNAQNLQQNDSIKVGLVLSGGGAKGFAHIGALKVIDSLGVKVDYVAGTSMGAILGALYVSGYSGKALDSIFKSLDFAEVINDNIPREAKTFYERNNSEKYAVTLPFNDFKLNLPSAISRGQNVFGLLSKLTLHVAEIHDFEKLPIPFFCVATNVETGQSVILDKGNLAHAITASGTFPSLFQPVTIDNQVLIDGGATNNYPIDELKSKGMDIIIGVDVQDSLVTREQLKSAPKILLQINNYRTINEMKKKVQKTDIYIKPDITGYNVISFGEGADIIKHGEAAAKLKTEALIKLKQLQKPSPPKTTKIAPIKNITIRDIMVSGQEKYTRAYILGKLKLKPNTTIDYDDFNKGVNNIIATNNFDSFKYKFIKTETEGTYDINATIKESEVTSFLRFGIHYDNLYKSAALINYTKKRLLFNNDVMSFDAILGNKVRYNFDYFIDRGFYWSIGLKSRFNQFSKDVYAGLFLNQNIQNISGLNKIDIDVQDQTNQFYLQTFLRKDLTFTMGVEHKRLKIKSETIVLNNQSDDFIFENTDYVSAYGNITFDSYTNKHFPKKGFYFNGYFHFYLYASKFNDDFSQFSIAKADFGYVHSLTDRLALQIMTQGGFKIGEDSASSLHFGLGGYGNDFINNYIPFYGYQYLSLTGNSFVKAAFTIDYEVFKKHHIIAAVNVANIENNIFETSEWASTPDYNGFALGYSIDTFLGPIEAKMSWSPEVKKSIWYFNIGFWF